MHKWQEKENFDFEDLVEIVDVLRGPEGCPWDQVQTHRSLRNNLIEEAYEVCEGIDQKDDKLLCEELGDLLLQIVFHIAMAEDRGAFTSEDVMEGICRKMIFRHPHVFSDQKEQTESWEEIKKREKGEESLHDSLSRISTSLPALKRGEKFIKKGAPQGDAKDAEESPLGADLYRLCRQGVDRGEDPEEALNKYLKCLLKKCTNCE